MTDKNKKTKSAGQPKLEPYLKIPYHIFNIQGLSVDQKMLLAHIYSFGAKGCWQGNPTLGQMFFISGRSISTWIRMLKKHGLILWVHPKGRYRTIWAKSHPDVKNAVYLQYMGEKISKEAVIKGHAAQILQRKNLPAGQEENFLPTKKNHVVQVGRNLLHTSNTTSKDTIAKTIAPPPPMPAGGQSPVALVERQKARRVALEKFGGKFGSAKPHQPLSEEQFQNRQQLLKNPGGGKKVIFFQKCNLDCYKHLNLTAAGLSLIILVLRLYLKKLQGNKGLHKDNYCAGQYL